MHGQSVAHPFSHLLDLSRQIERPAPFIGTIETLKPGTEWPGGELSLNVPHRVIQRFLHQYGSVAAGHRSLGKRGAPAAGDGDGALVPLRQPNRDLVIVL